MSECIAAQQATVTVNDLANAGSGPTGALQKQLKENLDPITMAMCKWAAPQYSVQGESWDRALWIAAQVALMGAYIALNTKIQNRQIEIADDYARMAEDKFNRFRDRYAPIERALLNEVSHEPVYKPGYAAARNRAVSATNQAFAQASAQLGRWAKSYALCVDPSLVDNLMQSRTRDDTINFNYRDEENYAQYRDDRRWNRRSDILNLGRGNSASAFSYASTANKALTSVAGTLQQAGNGLAGLFGYLNNRNDTAYPAQFAMGASLGNGQFLLSGGTPLSSS